MLACRCNWRGNSASERNFTQAIGQAKTHTKRGSEALYSVQTNSATMKLTLSWVDVFHLNAIKATLASLWKHTQGQGECEGLYRTINTPKCWSCSFLLSFSSLRFFITLGFLQHTHTHTPHLALANRFSYTIASSFNGKNDASAVPG